MEVRYSNGRNNMERTGRAQSQKSLERGAIGPFTQWRPYLYQLYETQEHSNHAWQTRIDTPRSTLFQYTLMMT